MICTSAHAIADAHFNADAHSFQDPMLMSLPNAHAHVRANLQSIAQAHTNVDVQASRVLFISLTHAHAPVPAHAHTEADVHNSSNPPPHPQSDVKRAGGIVWAGRSDYGCRCQITHGQSGGHNHNLKSFSSSLSSSS